MVPVETLWQPAQMSLILESLFILNLWQLSLPCLSVPPFSKFLTYSHSLLYEELFLSFMLYIAYHMLYTSFKILKFPLLLVKVCDIQRHTMLQFCRAMTFAEQDLSNCLLSFPLIHLVSFTSILSQYTIWRQNVTHFYSYILSVSVLFCTGGFYSTSSVSVSSKSLKVLQWFSKA